MRWRALALLSLSAVLAPGRASFAQGMSRPDSLLALGRWSEAEDAYYARSRARPRDPVARAALGRYLAMKGAVRPGRVLIQEAMRFGLDSAAGRAMLRPLDEVQRWRDAAASRPVADSVSMVVQPPRDSAALFRMKLPAQVGRTRDSSFADVVPAIVATTGAPAGRVGIQVLEAQVPAVDVRAHRLTLYADGRIALRTIGQRYPVLRDERGVYVLVSPGRVLPVATALRELDAKWWQLDLPHGLLVVR